ncbi:MAG TPA: DUF3857 domain-containing protein [Thermoanaerobaculia bacterium]|nr:DUF3857 domain-containing protein [Thermoanaerobaculia bacterium]
MKRTAILAILILTLLGARGAGAADFPPITDEERALTAVPGEPNAPAVVLFKKAELLMAGHGVFIGSLSSHLRVQGRVKILTEAGKGKGELAIDHSDGFRLSSFSGRTVLPDGRALPVPANAQFQRRTSKSSGTYVTSVAFPGVQAGAILDYQYEIVFSSPFVLEPWYLSDELPVRRAEIVFKMPKHLKVLTWTRAPLGVDLQRKEEDTFSGREVRAWAENLPAIPDVPYSPPFNELASQIVVLPAGYEGSSESLLADWSSTTYLLNRIYEAVREHGLGVEGPAREIAGSGSDRQKAEALYRYVRDRIRTEPGGGVLIDPDTKLRKIFSQASGTSAEKAVLLQEVLARVGITSVLVWAGDRNRGTMDPKLPNPNWFDTMLVAVRLDGKITILDPSAPELAFGQLRPGYEGTPALISVGAQRVLLPETPFDQNLRRAEIDLALDAKGRLAGTGTLRLTGLRSVERLHWKNDEAQTAQAWKDWLSERFKDFQIADVKTAEMADERKVTVTWSMSQREEEALGDEATLVPSAPLGPETQPFVQTAAERKIAVVFDYPARDEVELRLRWPEGWSLDQRPRPAAFDGPCGALSTAQVVDAEKRTLVYRRRFDITRRRLNTKDEYEAVRGLFGEAAKNDAQKLTLVRR